MKPIKQITTGAPSEGIEIVNTKKQTAKEKAIEAWRTLYYAGFLNDKEAESIKKKINTRYKIF